MTVVFNSSPLISLAKIESFHLLQQLYGTILISAEVYAEVVLSGSRLPGASETANAEWMKVRQVHNRMDVTAAQGRFGLGAGELSTIILAKEIEAELVILDDLGARKLAHREGFRVQGTVGILEACFRKGYLSDLKTAYEHLLLRGVFLNRDLLNRSLGSFSLSPL